MRPLVLTVLCLLSAAVLASSQAPPTPPATQEARVVKVTAEGYDHDDALKQALRKALEEGAGVQIAGFAQVENFALVRDTIYSRASGIVSEYKILREEEGPGGTVIITVEATVRPSAVAAAWGEVQNVLDQIGRPKIMVWVDERIDERLQDDSVVESRIEDLFLKAGFDLVERKAVEDLKRREADSAAREQDDAKLARLAKDAGAHLLIRGSASADRAGIRDVYGVRAAFYNCSVQAKAYYTDTAKLLASESAPVKERGVRSEHEFSPQAARAALVDATFPHSEKLREPVLATKLLDAVMEQWSTQLSAGGDIELEVAGLAFKKVLELEEALKQVQGVRSVNSDYTHGAGLYRIKAVIAAKTLARILADKPFSAWLEVTDLKPNRIQAKAVAPSSSGPAQ
jgi:copper chaperone CopZ